MEPVDPPMPHNSQPLPPPAPRSFGRDLCVTSGRAGRFADPAAFFALDCGPGGPSVLSARQNEPRGKRNCPMKNVRRRYRSAFPGKTSRGFSDCQNRDRSVESVPLRCRSGVFGKMSPGLSGCQNRDRWMERVPLRLRSGVFGKMSPGHLLLPKTGAQKRTRTSTPLRAPAPEAGASTNSAIWAPEAADLLVCCRVGARH